LPWRRNSLARSAAEVLGDGLMRRTRAAIREVLTEFLASAVGLPITVEAKETLSQDGFGLGREETLMAWFIHPLHATD